MKNILKKSIVFALLILMAQSAYPMFGVQSLSQWGIGAFSNLYDNAIRKHPWLTVATVSTVKLFHLYRNRAKRIEIEHTKAVIEDNHEMSLRKRESNKRMICRLATQLYWYTNQLSSAGQLEEVTKIFDFSNPLEGLKRLEQLDNAQLDAAKQRLEELCDYWEEAERINKN